MKSFIIGLFALALVACQPPGTTAPPVLGGPTANPITATKVYQLELAYEAAFLIPFHSYYQLGFCPGATKATLQHPCAERVVVRKLQGAKRVADVALSKLRAFVLKYPTLDATNYFNLAWQAVEGAKAIAAAAR